MFKKTVVLNTKKLKPKGHFTFDYKSLLFFTLFLCGLILGVSFIKSGDENLIEFLTRIFKNRISAEKNNSFLTCMCGDILPLLLLELFCFIGGLCAVGMPFIWLLPVGFGSFCGVVIALFFVNYGVTGLGYCALTNIPYYAITAATLIKCCCESTMCSNEVLLFALKGETNERKNNPILKDYTLKYLLLCVPIIIASAIRAGSSKLFSGLFDFI